MKTPNKYTCPRYEPLAGAKSSRCSHYKGKGRCDLPENKYCSEWLKINHLEEQSDLFGETTLVHKVTRDSNRHPTSKTAGQSPIPIVRNLTEEQITSFKALGAEVCISSPELGDVWLVPEYTDTQRTELSAEHAATLAVICNAFPGAKITAFHKEPKPENEPHTSTPTPNQSEAPP